MATQTTTPNTKRTAAKHSLTSQATEIQTPVVHETKPVLLPEIIHLGVDVHLRQYVVCR